MTNRNLANYGIIVLNIATVDVPGVIISLPLTPLSKHGIFFRDAGASAYIGVKWAVYIHIGVGSDVVCSTIIGNARASVRGIDSKVVPRFFYANGGKR